MFKRKRKNSRLDNAATSFGTVLGGIAAKVDHINKQRADVAKELEGFVKQAQSMMKDLSKMEMPFPKTRAAMSKEIVEPVRRKSATARKAATKAFSRRKKARA